MVGLQDSGVRLVAADDFIALAAAACSVLGDALGIPRSGIALHRRGGGPQVFVDNLGPDQDAYRLATVREDRYRGSPIEVALQGDPREFGVRAGAIGFVGDFGHAAVHPLVDPGGVIGSIQCGRAQPFSPALHHHLEVFAGQVSARLAQLGWPDVVAPSGIVRRGGLWITRGD